MFKIRGLLAREQEERFLNKQAAQNYELEYIAPFRLMPPLEVRVYKFNKISKARKVYRIDSRNFENQPELTDYLLLMKDSGWEQLKNNFAANSIYAHNQYYFYRDYSEGNDELFSDQASLLMSKINQYKRNMMYSVLLLLVYILMPFARFIDIQSGFFNFVLGNWFILIVILVLAINSFFYFVNKFKLNRLDSE